LFRIAVPQLLFFEWNRGKFWVSADRTHRDELADPESSGMLHHLNSHDRIVVKETTWVYSVSADTSNDRCQMDNHFGLCILKELHNLFLVPQIIFSRTRHHDVLVPASAQLIHYRRA